MPLQFDTLTVEITENGTIKTTTDQVSAANHANAEQFLKFMAAQLGGDRTRTRRGDVHSHGTHTHSHDHEEHDHDHS